MEALELSPGGQKSICQTVWLKAASLIFFEPQSFFFFILQYRVVMYVENIKPGVSVIKHSSGVLVLTQPKRSFGLLSLFLNYFKLKLLISQDMQVLIF